MNPNDFAKAVKTKYPEYVGVEDAALTQKVVSKYPQYASQIDGMGGGQQGQPQAQQPNAQPPSIDLIKAMLALNPQAGTEMIRDEVDPLKQSKAAYNRAQAHWNLNRSSASAKLQPTASLWVNPDDNMDTSLVEKPGFMEFKMKPSEVAGKAIGVAEKKYEKNPTLPTWDNASPEDRRIAVGLYSGTLRPGSVGYREKTKYTGLAAEYGEMIGKPYVDYTGEVRAGTEKSFAYGKLGQNALSLNTALGHAKSALDAFGRVKNTNAAALNVPLNKIKGKMNDPNIIQTRASLNALRGELATTFKGSGGTDQEIASWMEVLNEGLTPTQADGAIREVNDLLNSRLSALKYQQSSVMGGNPQRQLLSPHAAELNRQFSQGKESTLKTQKGTVYSVE
jgi:hypothetical protein